MLPGDMFVCPHCCLQPTALRHLLCDVCKSNRTESQVMHKNDNWIVYVGRYRHVNMGIKND